MELKKAHDSALRAAATKGKFLANMSHEIRTPMNGVLGYANLLAEEDLTPRQNKFVNSILESGHSMLQILNDILDLSKIDAGQIHIEEHDFQLHELAHSVFQLFENSVNKGVSLKLEIDSQVPKWVKSDSTRIRQILLNLVSNAAKFTQKGTIYIKLTTASINEVSAQIHFTVTDTGIGIEPHLLNKLFKEFTQADISTTRKFGGTGLGLTISQKLATLLGSRIEVDSLPGSGSCFHFVLELQIGSPTTSQQTFNPLELLGDTSDLQVLLVEDNPINLDLGSGLLEKLGITPDTAQNGLEALSKASEQLYDIIFMDCQMPVMDGYEATAQIRQLQLKTQPVIIALTANAMQGDQEKCLDIGMDDYLSKPVSKNKIADAIIKWRKKTYTSVS